MKRETVRTTLMTLAIAEALAYGFHIIVFPGMTWLIVLAAFLGVTDFGRRCPLLHTVVNVFKKNKTPFIPTDKL